MESGDEMVEGEAPWNIFWDLDDKYHRVSFRFTEYFAYIIIDLWPINEKELF